MVDSVTSGFGDVAAMFGESASRVVVSIAASRTAELQTCAAEAGVPATIVGRVGGRRIRVAVAGRGEIDASLSEAERQWSCAIGNYFESQRAFA